MPIREIKLKSDKEQIFEHFSEGAQPPRSSFQGWLEPPSPHVVGAYYWYKIAYALEKYLIVLPSYLLPVKDVLIILSLTKNSFYEFETPELCDALLILLDHLTF